MSTPVLAKFSVKADSNTISGNTAYPEPGLTTSIPITLSKDIMGASIAATLGAG